MIQVIIQPGSIQVTGHAGAGPPGHDLVCAAVSTLVQTFVRSAEQLTDAQLHSDIAPGRAFVRYEGSPQVQLLADSFLLMCSVFLRSTQRRLRPPSRFGILRAETKRRDSYDPICHRRRHPDAAREEALHPKAVG